MSHFLDRLTFFKRIEGDFADGHGITTNEDRRWEDGYRKRWQHDKIVRSTHGANCTGSCSWKIYVKGGIVTWETQQTDYPAHASRPAQPRAARLLARRQLQLVSLFRQPREVSAGALAPAEALARSAQRCARRSRPGPRSSRTRTSAQPTPGSAVSAASCARPGTRSRDHRRGQRLHREDLRARPHRSASRRSRPCRWSPTRRARATCRCSAASACRSTTGTATCRREPADLGRADRRAGIGRLVQFGLPDRCGAPTCRRRARPTRTSIPRRATRARSRRHLPGLFRGLEIRRPLDLGKQGTDAALAMAMGHVILREFHLDRQAQYFADYARQYTDLPMLVRLVKQDGRLRARADRCAPPISPTGWARRTTPTGRPSPRRGDRRDRRADRLDRLPLGREGQVEPRGEGGRGARIPTCA